MSSDEELRRLERAWRASGSDDAGAAWLAARLRRGDLDEARLARLAGLGFGPAIALLGDDAPDTAWPDGTEHLDQLPGRPGTRAAIVHVWARHFLPAWEAAHPDDPRGRGWLDRLRELAALGEVGDVWPRLPELPGLSGEETATLRRWFGNDPRMPSLAGVLPDAARGLPLERVARQLRADLAAERLGAPLEAEHLRELTRARLELVACADAPLDVVQRTAAWLDDLSSARPRPLRVTVAPERPTFTDLQRALAELLASAGGRRSDLFGHSSTPRTFALLVTLQRDREDWFARHHPSSPRLGVVHLGEQARAKLEASPEVFLGHFVAKKALDGVLGREAPRHEPSRGCAFDFCRDKKALDGRILAGAVCCECHALLRQQPGVREEHLAGLLRILAAARERMLAAR